MEKKLIIERQWFIGSKTTDINQDYQILQQLGSGAYGIVFQAQDRRSSILRAVKVIQKIRVQDYKSLVNEISILRNLDHPNIVNIIESYETERVCFLVLEYCYGGEMLNRLVKQQYFCEAHVAHIMKQLISAVMYSHNHGICHRDLKPDNCLYVTDAENSEIKVIDFGLAISLTEERLLDGIAGTPYYVAPEMLAGNYTIAVDCWSMGVMMYLMLSGIPPFQGRDTNEIMMSIYNGCFTFRHKIFLDVSDQAKDLICCFLRKDPNLRITAAQAYTHPWIQSTLHQYKSLPLSLLQSIQLFVSSTSLKKASLMFIASKLSETDISNIRNYFKMLDTNGDGVVSHEELFNGIKNYSFFPSDKFDVLTNALDSNNNGVVDYTEFLAACLLRKSFTNAGYIESAFKYFDKDDSGLITVSEIREVLSGGEILHILSTNQIEQMVGEIDKNKDGFIDYKEFIEMFKQRSLL